MPFLNSSGQRLVSAVVFLCVSTTSWIASAQPRGTVLKIDGPRVYVDVGNGGGVTEGSALTLFHVIAVRHPVTGKKVRDSFPLAELTVVNAGKAISIATVPGPFQKRVAVGDEVELASEPTDVRDPWRHRNGGDPQDPYANSTNAVTSVKKRAGQIRAAEEKIARVETLEKTWAETLGKSPEERIAVWQRYLGTSASGPYRPKVRKVIDELEALVTSAETPSPGERAEAYASARVNTLLQLLGFGDRQSPSRRVDEAIANLQGGPLVDPLLHVAPTAIDEGVPLPLAFLVRSPAAVEKAWLYYRKVGDDSYLRLELASDGDSYLVGEVPADSVRPPGVEYFVEMLDASAPDGSEPRPVVFSNETPRRVSVNKAPGPAIVDTRGRSQVTTRLEYVDFDGVGSEFDQYWYGEVDFKYRFRKPWIYSLSLGFGTLQGTGGPKDVIDEDPTNSCLANGEVQCDEVAYNYAYAELEWHISDYFGIALRPLSGSAYRDPGLEGSPREFFSAFGLRGRVRFGREDASNLVIGASATQELGQLYEASFTWDVIQEFPLAFSVHVTDQPVLEDLGVRLLADVGWRRFKHIYPSLRLAYQARDIDHAGISGGLAVNFDW